MMMVSSKGGKRHFLAVSRISVAFSASVPPMKILVCLAPSGPRGNMASWMILFASSGVVLLYWRIWASGNRSMAVRMSKGLVCLSVSRKRMTVFLVGLVMFSPWMLYFVVFCFKVFVENRNGV